MNINVVKLKNSLEKVNAAFKSTQLKKILSKSILCSEDIDKIIDILCHSLYSRPNDALIVRENAENLLFAISAQLLDMPEKNFEDFQKKCIVMSVLAADNHLIMGCTLKYLQTKKLSPFCSEDHTEKKRKKLCSFSSLDIVKMSWKFLTMDFETYRRLWNWKEFIEIYQNEGCDLQKYLCNLIVGKLFGMKRKQISAMNEKIPKCVIAKHEIEISQLPKHYDDDDETELGNEIIEWKFLSDSVMSIEGVFLPMFSSYNEKESNIVRVESTKNNLRSLAMGISSGKAICVSGPVGSGKSSLVEHIAKRVGRIFSKTDTTNENENGFLRIQLGENSDSKVLLGQYRCTDVPGEFVFQTGVLTQAIMNGYWLLLEDIDSATQDVITVISQLLENNCLRVPGFHENIKISSGFQLFITLRTQKLTSTLSGLPLLEKYLYNVNLTPLSKSELIEIICTNFPKLAIISPRIVDIFLLFAGGFHVSENQSEINNGINCGRMVSTRDLLKLCERSCPTFQATSIECAELVFQNCIDLFCSHLSAGTFKTNMTISTGSYLGIIETRCVYFSDEYRPPVRVNSDEIVFTRASLDRRKKLKNTCEQMPTFSFTRVASCILERIAVAVLFNEPILLVGETGVGKTSSIQYLAYQTNHKLVVINMNNQSDVADLIGGFKPVDMNFVISPLRIEFERLFLRTFDVMKNEKFLGHVTETFKSQNYSVLIKLMLRVTTNVYESKAKTISTEELNRWKLLEVKLKKLEKQLKTSAHLSFSFITGSLVECIRNGDWILLDEINLATAETLECLSMILESEGSVTLFEKGDFVPVKRHPDFRIFACMNPSTDVGKKDLPIGIRNRFTEIFADELTSENDLLILVGDYFSQTGIEKSRINQIVQLYQELKSLSQLELTDGLGNKPVFSLRTLCRALKTCTKNVCGSMERNVYESFCMSFLTQLDPASYEIVQSRIRNFLISDAKKILSQKIPKPAGNQIYIEGYWITMGDKEPQKCEEYILTGSVQKNLKDIARIVSIGKLPILLQGPTSAGKTSLIEYIAKMSGNHCLRINNHEHTDLQEYIGAYATDVSGKLVFQEGVLVKAMRFGYWIILDELNLASSDILEALNRVLDDNRELYIPETQTVINAHPNFMLFATQNPPGIYGGRKTLSRAFKNRFIELHFAEIPNKELEIILEKRCEIPMKYAQKMVKAMSALQVNRRTASVRNNFTLRDLFRWGNRYSKADKGLLDDRNYDWNQHLVDEGFLVLSAKVRNEIEIEIIVETLQKIFSKKIEADKLFSLNENTSMVTKAILTSVLSYDGNQKVVWTTQLRRMAVLISKALIFDEPVLLVGPTGCGKTTICQILAEIWNKQLRILNCHMHTESSDFLGSLRPNRQINDGCKNQLFVWADGPLIYSMNEGSFFLADEISLAEDSVLERLNCLLEPERTLLLAEKGGGINENIIDSEKNAEFIIQASKGFQFLATMNPGGDFGKKELSPALRNRFTEIWCTASYSYDDLVKICVHTMTNAVHNESSLDIIHKIAKVVVQSVKIVEQHVEKFNFSVRDILAWINYIIKNYFTFDGQQSCSTILQLNEVVFFGIHTIFLDALEMLPYEDISQVIKVRKQVLDKVEKLVRENFNENFANIDAVDKSSVEIDDEKFGISPFYIKINEVNHKKNYFSFSAPTTKSNLFRILSALTLKKSILLEGPPGVGKSSIIENIANTIGCNIVRINLCEHTDITDLFGTDLPVESTLFDEKDVETTLGNFVWRDGPLLAALKSPNTWILLDELNLAPQSVLEGLNAILDHRGEVYIPELNKSFQLRQQNRIFATQNPLRQGGGRKGLPQSFLNRFTKVYLRKLAKNDLLHVIYQNFASLEDSKELKEYSLIERMVSFSQRIEDGIANMEFGYKGGPFEANLRDMLRWCELITNSRTGCDVTKVENIDSFLLTLFEKMKLVYCQRMRVKSDIESVQNIFGEIFEVNAYELNRKSNNICLYWNDNNIFINDITIGQNPVLRDVDNTIILSTQLETIKNVAECVITGKPVIVCGSGDSGKTKITNVFCAIADENLYSDTIEDSITGNFQQFDLNQILQNVWHRIEEITFAELTVNHKKDLELFELWREHENMTSNFKAQSEVDMFQSCLKSIEKIIYYLKRTVKSNEIAMEMNKMLSAIKKLEIFLQHTGSLNTGGHFEWVNSMIVKSMERGYYICLDHINLISSAILDRLNPILEPNGNLIISEKGVQSNDEVETISKHPNFRIFLTMDPKHGEISRAMRNRCIELSIGSENYTEDDLRKLIFIQGVHNINLIRAIIKIHKEVSVISEFCSFGVSSIMKMAFMVTQNRALGVDTRKALIISANEVYVQSSSIDLFGHEKGFFREKMRTVIAEIVKNYEHRRSFVNYQNLIVNCKELTEMKMIKLQAEAFISLMYCSNEEDVKFALGDLHTNLQTDEIKDLSTFKKIMLTFMYGISSLDDAELRFVYLQENLPHLKELNESLYEIIRKTKTNDLKIDTSLPWNQQLYPRLRISSDFHEFSIALTIKLFLESTLNQIMVKKASKTAENLDAISYSKSVLDRSITDTVDNQLITHLYRFMNSFKNFAATMIVSWKDENIAKTLLSFQWFNRLLEVSYQQLFNRKNIKEEIIDELYLHFKWFSKHCITIPLPKADVGDFVEIFNEINNFILQHHHSLQVHKKVYTKQFTLFLPFYDEWQVQEFERIQKLDGLLKRDPNDPEKSLRKLKLMTKTNFKNFQKIFLNQVDSQAFMIFNGICCFEDSMDVDINHNAYIASYKQILKEIQSQEEENDSNELDVLPIFEYFFIKSIRLVIQNDFKINHNYVLNTPSLDFETLRLVQTIGDEKFDIIRKMSENSVVSNEFYKCFASFSMSLECSLQKCVQNSMTRRLHGETGEDEIYIFLNGPLLTSNMFQCILSKSDAMKGIAVGETENWRAMLNKLRDLLWINAGTCNKKFDLLRNEMENSQKSAKKLIKNTEEMKTQIEIFTDSNADFWSLVDYLKQECQNNEDKWSQNFIISSLSAAIELNLLSYFPIIDPVKKKSLKTKYLQQDIDELDRLGECYKIMSVILNYQDFGCSDKKAISDELKNRHDKISKLTKKVPIRPKNCAYSSMVKDINHFLKSFCLPSQLLQYVKTFKLSLKSSNKLQLMELMTKLELWISNAEMFLSHTLQNYQSYYRDFTAPTECCITRLKSGFLGFKSILQMRNDSIQVIGNEPWDCNQNGELDEIVKDLLVFPKETSKIDNEKFAKMSLIFQENGENVVFNLLKASIHQTKNLFSIMDGHLHETLLNNFNQILCVCNDMWMKQNEARVKKNLEENSLYVTKSKCQEDSDETIREQLIARLFPESLNDFGEFTISNSLEEVKINVPLKNESSDLITDDCIMISSFFIEIMNDDNLSKSRDYVNMFSYKLKAFQSIFRKFSSCLDNSIDDSLYNSLCLLIGVCQDKYEGLNLRDTNTKYNFYKDSNINEAMKCVDILKRLEDRVKVELEQWPEHATLIDILTIINRIRGFSSSSPLVRFNIGLQILRQKVHEWNQVAHKLNNLLDIEAEIAGLIQTWMQMELQCWRESLTQTFQETSDKAHIYWFFLYNELCDATPTFNLSKELEEFMESSNFAEFELRLKLMKAFQHYFVKSPDKSNKMDIISTLHNIHAYYSQFIPKVREQIDFSRRPIEDKLKKLIKINSFNKELSYFSTESNIKQVHRHLYEHLKEFGIEIKKKVRDLFVYRDQSVELDVEYPPIKKLSTNLGKFLIKDEDFLSSQNIPKNIEFASKYTPKMREKIKKSLENVNLTTVFNALAEDIEKELEACRHLRSLKVDENLTHGKKKSQAKSILNQKRKALTNFFKLLAEWGINYRSGLLKSAMNEELLDLKIIPFELKSIVGDKEYFNKSIFKLKLLLNMLHTPHTDMDYEFLERIKGISIECFNVAQSQRVKLSASANALTELKQYAMDIEIVTNNSSLNYQKEFEKVKIVRESFIHATEILEQLQMLLKCAPDNEVSENLIVISTINSGMWQKNTNFKNITEKINNLRAKTVPFKNAKFITNGAELVKKLEKVVNELRALESLFIIDGEVSVFGQPIHNLCIKMSENLKQINEIEAKPCEKVQIDEKTVNNLHLKILLAIQYIIKKYENVEGENEQNLMENFHFTLLTDVENLSLLNINEILAEITNSVYNSCDDTCIEMLKVTRPLLKQFVLLADYYLVQQGTAHQLFTKMLSIMLSVFLELTKNGFCIPQNLLNDEEQKNDMDDKRGEGFGFEDGQGEKDVSDKIESEDQLDEARRPDDYNKNGEEENKSCKEEKGIDMSENFDGKMFDKEDNDDNEAEEKENEGIDKEMEDVGNDAEKLDDQIWGSDEEENGDEQGEENKKDETGVGSGDKNDAHNSTDAENSETKGEQEEELDAVNEGSKKNDVDKMNHNNDEEEDGDQINPFHNELEEPPEAEDFDLNEDIDMDKKEEGDDNEKEGTENPFDIDKMKDAMEVEESEENQNGDENPPQKESEVPSDSEHEEDITAGQQSDDEPMMDNDLEENNLEENIQGDQIDPDSELNEQKNDFESDTPASNETKESKVQAASNQFDKGSSDAVECEMNEDMTQNADTENDTTGREESKAGQADSQESSSGHDGANVPKAQQAQSNKSEAKRESRKKGNTSEQRTIEESGASKVDPLKTVEELNGSDQQDMNNEDEGNGSDADEYRHVKETRQSDKTTIDSATKEQSEQAKMQVDDKFEDELESDEKITDLNDEQEPEAEPENIDEIKSEKISKSETNKKRSTKTDTNSNITTEMDELEIDGENIQTSNLQRKIETSAHCKMDIVRDATSYEEVDQSDDLLIRKAINEQRPELNSVKDLEPSDIEKWHQISNKMTSNARELCEQLRLILEPTKCTRLKGDYRTGRRINMKKIIPYIASQFQKDKIWLRRTKAAQRDYKITIAVDDSKSMDHNNSKELTLQAISLVSQALTLLESGKLSIASFGESSKTLLKYDEQFNGLKLLSSLNFSQNKTRIAELLDFARIANENSASGGSFFEHLLIILSDGRNIFNEGEKRVRNAIKKVRQQRIFIIYIIIDNPSNKDSIMDIQTVLPFTAKSKTTTILPYMDLFPFPYYVIVRDINQLPLVLSEGLRQWFELVNSE